MATVVLCTEYGTLKPQQVNGRQAELADLLVSFPSSMPPAGDVLAAVMATIPSADGLLRLAQKRWATSSSVAAYQAILDAYAKLFEGGAIKPAALDFMTELRARLVGLVQDSLALFGACEGAVYDEVYGEGADKALIPSYLPVVSHFQLHFHEIVNDPALGKRWAEALQACGAALPEQEDGMGSSPARRALVYMLSLGQDIAYLRLCQALLHASCQFSYQ